MAILTEARNWLEGRAVCVVRSDARDVWQTYDAARLCVHTPRLLYIDSVTLDVVERCHSGCQIHILPFQIHSWGWVWEGGLQRERALHSCYLIRSLHITAATRYTLVKGYQN